MKKLMRKKLALMLANLKKERPYYCEVEYLENSSKQYIDTGYYPNNNTKVEFMASGISADSFSASSSGTWFLGARQAYQDKMFGSYYNPSNTRLHFAFGSVMNYLSYTTSNMYGNNKVFVMDKNGLYINGTKVVDNSETGTFTSPVTLTLFGLNNNGTVLSTTKYKVHCLKIWDGNTLVRDYVPVLDWDGVPCMYDKVSGQLFYNAGTGTFSYGREIHPVEYLESTGAQYIDTLTTMGDLSQFELETKLQTTFESDVVYALGVLLRQSSSSTSQVKRQVSINRSSASNGKYRYSIVKDGVATTVDTLSSNDPVEIKISGTNITVNGTQYQNPFSGTLTEDTLSFYLFGWHRGNGIVPSLSQQKIYYYKIKKSGVLVRDFIPAVDQSGIGFMFDRVTHTIFGNAGTGAFKYPDVELEYLESTGTQYINAGFVPNQDTKVELEYKITRDSSAGFPLFCVRESASARGYSYQRYANGFMGGQYGSNINRSQTIGPDLNKHVVVRDKNILYLDGVEIVSQEQQTFTCPSNLCINALNTNGTIVVADCGVSYYYMKAWNNNTLVCNLVPVYHNGVACMYDKVSRTYFTNAGTGTFSCKIKEKP